MDRQLSTARLLLTIPAAFLAVGPAIADLNASHVLNPLWSPHARLHTVWLISTNSLISLIALGLLWRPGQSAEKNSFLLAAALVGAVLLGFFIAGLTQPLYGGAFTDENGVELRVGPLDANLFGFSVLFLLVAVAAVRVRQAPRSR